MSTASGKRKAQQSQAVVRLLILLAILICVNLIASRLHYSLDLTQEKRFSLTAPTKKMLRGMDDVAVIDVYLEGKNFPPGFQRLRDAVRERLQSFKEYAGTHIQYRFSNPLEGKGKEELEAMQTDYASRGMPPMNINATQDERESSQWVVPYALVHYKGKELPVSLVERHSGMNGIEQLNYSESLLEYKLASGINQANKVDKPRIAYVLGNDEAFSWKTADALSTLGSLYRLDTIDINYNSKIPSFYQAVVICKPTQAFSEKEKFKIDQYLMRGGKILWYLDAMQAEMDSLKPPSQQFISVDYPLKLNDMLFKYGARVNNNLIEDLYSGSIYATVMTMAGKPEPVLRGWYYFPVFVPTSHHPIVNNMDGIEARFASTIDTIATPANNIKKTILLESSQYSRTAASPVRVSLSMLNYPPKPELFTKGFQPTAVLLEGKFPSLYQDRVPVEFKKALDSLKQPFLSEGERAGAMIIVGDGDMMLNEVNATSGPQELGYAQQEKVRYANKSFLLNCMEYLTDSVGLLEARSKEVRLRLLDGGRIKAEKGKWQIINFAVPICFVLIFASCYLFFRKRRYEGV